MVRESGLIVLRISRPTPNVDQELSGATTTDLKQANVAGELHPDTANYPIGGAVVISMGLERRPCCIANDAASITQWLRDVPTRAFIAMEPTARYYGLLGRDRRAELVPVCNMLWRHNPRGKFGQY